LATKSIIGLGNPGDRYRHTRHNLGFRVVESLEKEMAARAVPSRKSYSMATCRVGTLDLHLVKPLTYMNCSGHGVMEYLEDSGVDMSDFLIVCDDVYLPLGRIRLKRSGGDAGHNGMASIIEFLGSETFCRLRIGVGLPTNTSELATYVLRPFPEEESPEAEAGIARACEAAVTFVREGIEAAMNKFNG
jgi:PTH1 family peptidyl-tRNA hydrolase